MSDAKMVRVRIYEEDMQEIKPISLSDSIFLRDIGDIMPRLIPRDIIMSQNKVDHLRSIISQHDRWCIFKLIDEDHHEFECSRECLLTNPRTEFTIKEVE